MLTSKGCGTEGERYAQTIDSKEDDLYIMEYALSENALILTRDCLTITENNIIGTLLT